MNASSKRVEIDVDSLGRFSKKIRTVKGSHDEAIIGTEYEFKDGKKVILLAEGYPINFYASESVPDKLIDLILTLLLCGAAKLTKSKLGAGVHKCGINETAIARSFYQIYHS